MERNRFERWLTGRMDRRRFLALAATGSGAISLRGRPTRALSPAPGRAVTRPRFAENPFQLGVASGDPVPDGVVLWTRLVTGLDTSAAIGPDPIEVSWEIAADDAFRQIVQSGRAVADPALAHSVHLDVAGLAPATTYFYRFTAGGEVSAAGRTKTAPAIDAHPDRLRFGFVSCANYEHGYFTAYRAMAADDNDLVLCLGDYFYEYGHDSAAFATAGGPVREVTGGDTVTLEDYRARHALYKTDPDLLAAHLAAPWIVTWDDHEVENDYAGLASGMGESPDDFLTRRIAAYQAYYEHMPLRPESMPAGPGLRLYRRLRFGDLVELSMLDTRQYRSPHPCPGVDVRCDAALDPAVTMTGAEQERWLLEGLAASDTHWQVIGQQVMMAQLQLTLFGTEPRFNNDQWDGYPLARQRILNAIRDARVDNVVVLSGDIHSAWVCDLKTDFDNAAAPVVASEFVCASVTSYNPFARQLRLALPANPHIRFTDPRHGYCQVDLTPDRWTTEFRALESVRDPAGVPATIATWIVEGGNPGVIAG